jgi:hypothetical protein
VFLNELEQKRDLFLPKIIFPTVSTGLLALRRLTAARATKNPSRALPFVVFFSATFFCARKNTSHFSLSGTKKRRQQPER